MLKKLISVAHLILLLSLTLFLGLAIRPLLTLLHSLNRLSNQAIQTATQFQTETHGTFQNLNAVLIQAGLTSDELRRAAMEQRGYWKKNSVETHQLLTDLDTVVVVNGAALVRQIQTNGSQLNLNLKQLGDTEAKVGASAEDFDRLLVHVNSDMYLNDEKFTSLMDSLSQTGAHVAAASESIQVASKDIQEKVHQVTRPAKWWMSVGETILSTGAQVGSWVVGFFK